MKKQILRRVAAVAAICLLSACGNAGVGRSEPRSAEPSPPSESVSEAPPSEPPEESGRESAASSDAAPVSEPDDSPVLRENGQRFLYIYQPETGNYRKLRQVENDGTLTMRRMLLTVCDEIGVQPVVNDLYFMSTEYAGGGPDDSWPVIDLDGGFIDTQLADADAEARFLNSVSASMRDQYLITAKITFLRDGGPYRSAHLSMGETDAFEQRAVSLGALTPDEYTALRAMVPYTGLARRYHVASIGEDFILDPPTARGPEFVELLTRVGDPGRDIASPADFTNDELLWIGLESSEICSIGVNSPQYPIAESVQDAEVTYREHIENAVRIIFAEDFTLKFHDIHYFRWHENEGVYTPPHAGGGLRPRPVIYSADEREDRYVLTVGYIPHFLGYIEDEDMDDYMEELRQAALDNTDRREVVLLKQPDGSVSFYSHRFLRA